LTLWESERYPRPVCGRCRRPLVACYCQHLPVLETRTRVVVLQHPRERDMAIGTARMAHLCLPNSELHVGANWEDSAALRRTIGKSEQPSMLLYPSEGATDVAMLPINGPLTLVVVDGTWSNTKKMVQKNPTLAALPRLAFQPPRPSDYRIRKEPKPHCVSTVEALAHVLGVLEGDTGRFRALLEPFRHMIDRQIELKEHYQAGPRRHAIRKDRPLDVPLALREKSADIVCVVGEANAWPYCQGDSRERYPDELVHWVACRLGDGRAFDFVARPRAPLAPNTVKHVGLSEEQLHVGGSIEELCAEWQAFVRDTDIVCSWGCYTAGLLAQSGGVLPRLRFDLRALTKQLLKRKLGTMEQFLAHIGDESLSTLGPGRAGLRLGQLTRIARCLSEGKLPRPPRPTGASL